MNDLGVNITGICNRIVYENSWTDNLIPVKRFSSFVIIEKHFRAMGTGKIPTEIVHEANKDIAQYNARHYRPDSGVAYRGYAKGDYLYIDRNEYGNAVKTLRLRFMGKTDNWDFEIFRWSSERYTDDIFGMPGEQYLDGTIGGALKAADTLYPPPGEKQDLDMFQQLMRVMGSKD